VQLVSISSITAEALVRRGHDLTQEAVGWKEHDAYFASANMEAWWHSNLAHRGRREL
jgi:hypothetical protein